MQTLLDLGASPDYKDSRGLTPLYHSAMVGGDPYCCELLLHDYARLGCVDENGWQEIHQVGWMVGRDPDGVTAVPLPMEGSSRPLGCCRDAVSETLLGRGGWYRGPGSCVEDVHAVFQFQLPSQASAQAVFFWPRSLVSGILPRS